jgi:hypothetical protein
MATIKQMLGTSKAEELYALKDKLKDEGILDSDPMKLNRTRFNKYLAAKAEALIVDMTDDGVEVDAAFRKAELYLTVLDTQWREAAKAINEVRYPKRDMVDVTS